MNEGSALLEPKSGYQRKLPIKQDVEERMRKTFLPCEATGQQNALCAAFRGAAYPCVYNEVGRNLGLHCGPVCGACSCKREKEGWVAFAPTLVHIVRQRRSFQGFAPFEGSKKKGGLLARPRLKNVGCKT